MRYKEGCSFLKKRTKKLFDFGLRGPASVRANKQKSFASFLQKRSAFFLFAAGAAALLLVPADLRRAKDLSLDMQDRAGKTLNVTLAHDGMWRLRTEPEDLDPTYLALLLRQEDRRFYSHAGIDPLALGRAVLQFAVHGRVVSGGSTLTMQVARLLSPHRHTLLGKLEDMVVAARLEARFSKREILALYLTLAPMGGNLEGVRAASLRYFGHAPDHLSPAEAALLVALPQSPARRRPDRHLEAAEAAVARVLARAGTTPEPWQPHFTPFPHLAFHLAARLRAGGAAGPVRTTLEASLQRTAEGLARREAGWAGPGAQAAVLMVRNRDRSVLAYVGDTDRSAPGGQVDMVHAVRSPGSALKPFIYGLAMDDGLIRPDTLIEDSRLRIADYAPQDFDRSFRGTVTAAAALQQSYNLPAVTVLDWVGAARMAAVLRGAGASLVLPGGAAATLPLALGGVGMTLWDVTGLYAGLGDGGVVWPLRVAPGDAVGAGVSIMSAEAAGSVLTILREAPRPAGFGGGAAERVAYKTGTSFGFRDAWAFGVTRAVTAGVWVGRADGTPRPGAFARETAAPLLFRLLDLLPAEERVAGGGVLVRETPAGMQRLVARDSQPLLGASRPRIVYPPPDVLMSLPAGASLKLEASGGHPPYAWAVNGTPVAGGHWQPDGPGFVHVTLTDRMGRSAQEDLQVQ